MDSTLKKLLIDRGIDSDLIDNVISKVSKPHYGVIDNGVFGTRVVVGIITGFKFTENNKPVYELTLGANNYWTSDVTTDKNDILDLLKIGDLTYIHEAHKMQLKYN